MNIELRNVGFINKGSELMLHAILQRLSQEWSDTNFVMVADNSRAPYIKRAKLGFYQKPWYNLYGISFHELGRMIPKVLRNAFGLILDSELNVVLDASGFSYSEQWYKWDTITLSKATRRWKNHNTKVILLPQAFGPFTSKDLINSMNIVADYADLIYARDPLSYEYLVKAVGKRANIKMAPDFTNLLIGVVPHDFNLENNRFCIVPNYRMIDKTTSDIGAAYLPFLITCIEYLQEKRANPFILIHEGKYDIELAQKVAGSLNKAIEIVKESDPLRIKGIIGTCEGTLGSRFHGLVNALSQGVPTLGTGWSHKYKMLFESYNCSECLLTSLTNNDETLKKIDYIINEPSKTKIREKIVESSIKQKLLTAEMWNDVIHLINK